MPLNPRETALVRGWIEGLPYPVLAKTYLDRDDALAARAEVRALLARLVRKARQLGQGALAELFAAPPEGDRAAWRVKAHRALDRLAAAPEPVPGPADPVALWFEPRLAEALAAAGLPRLADLQAARVAGGARWWRPYPGIGPAAAQAVEACLAALPAGLPAPPADAPRPTPIEALYAGREALDGRHGAHRERRRRCRIAADTDREAVEAWLALYADRPGTCRQYRREVERFWAFCLKERGKALSDADAEDAAAYLAFLARPHPDWVGPPGAVRGSPAWRPLRRPLSSASRRLARAVLTAFGAWLVQQGYWEAHPFDALPKSRAVPERPRRVLPRSAVLYLLGHADRCARAAATQAEARRFRRLAFVLTLAYETGLRLGELVGATTADLVRETLADGDLWWLRVRGKGDKPREVPVSEALLRAIGRELAARGAPLPGAGGPPVPLIGKLRGEGGLTASGLHRALVGFARSAAEALAGTDPEGAARLARVTWHWLRHSYASHALEAGVPLEAVRENLGHASLATTSRYITAERARRHRETTRRHRAPGEGVEE